MRRDHRSPHDAAGKLSPQRGERLAWIILTGCLFGLVLLFGVLTVGVVLHGDNGEPARAARERQSDAQELSIIKLERVAPAPSPASGIVAHDGARDEPAEP